MRGRHLGQQIRHRLMSVDVAIHHHQHEGQAQPHASQLLSAIHRCDPSASGLGGPVHQGGRPSTRTDLFLSGSRTLQSPSRTLPRRTPTTPDGHRA